MPIDYSTTGPLILVRNRAGITVPFSTGALATSILVTGVPTPLAYEIADRVTRQLRGNAVENVDSDELLDRTTAELESLAGTPAAERFRAWQSARRSGRPLVLCLTGAPGVGKSTIANRLAMRMGVQRVVPTPPRSRDSLRCRRLARLQPEPGARGTRPA